MSSADPVFQAIVHPVRRKILSLLLESNRTVQELTSAFTISQPAISEHLRCLRTAGLVSSQRVGNGRVYQLVPEPLQEVSEWCEHFKPFKAT